MGSSVDDAWRLAASTIKNEAQSRRQRLQRRRLTGHGRRCRANTWRWMDGGCRFNHRSRLPAPPRAKSSSSCRTKRAHTNTDADADTATANGHSPEPFPSSFCAKSVTHSHALHLPSIPPLPALHLFTTPVSPSPSLTLRTLQTLPPPRQHTSQYPRTTSKTPTRFPSSPRP